MKHCNELRWLALCLLLAGCAGAPPVPTSVPAAQPSSSESIEAPATRASEAAQTHFAVALDFMRRERYEDAAIALEAMTRSYPELITPYLNLAIAFERSGHADKAEQTLRAALVQHPRSALAYNHLGLLYRQGGRFSQAREAYEQALKIDPDYTDAHFNLAILYDLYLQQPSSAFLHYEYYRHAGGNDPMVERWLADLRQRMSQPAAGAKP